MGDVSALSPPLELSAAASKFYFQRKDAKKVTRRQILYKGRENIFSHSSYENLLSDVLKRHQKRKRKKKMVHLIFLQYTVLEIQFRPLKCT